MPLVQVDPFSGKVGNPGGRIVEHYDQLVRLHTSRVIAELAGDRVVSARVYAYELEVWSAEGTRLGDLVPDAPWFRPLLDAGSAPEVMVVGLRASDEKTVAVLLLERTDREFPLETSDSPPPRELHSGQIEVLDLSEGKVLARLRRLPAITRTVCPHGEISMLVKSPR